MGSSVKKFSPEQTVLLLGNYRPTLTLARELSKRGYSVMSGRAGCDGGAEYSRCTVRIWDHPSLRAEPELFLKELSNFVQTHGVNFVYPVLEEYVAFFANNSLEHVSGALIASVPPEMVRKSLDKSYMMKMADRLNIPTAPFAEVTEIGDLIEQSNRIGFPMVVRPVSSALRLGGDKKAVILEDFDELHANFAEWPPGQSGLILQERVLGRRFNVYFTALNGKLIRYLHTAIHTTDKQDGTGLAVEGRAVPSLPDLQKYTEKFARALNYSGVGCAQYIVNESSGRTSFLEINPRIVGSHAVAEYAGLEMSEFPIKLALGHEIDTSPFAGKTDFRYVWTIGALQAAKIAWSSGDITTQELFGHLVKISHAFIRARVHMVFSLSDPLPAFVALVSLLPSWSNFVWRLSGQKGAPLPVGSKNTSATSQTSPSEAQQPNALGSGLERP